MPVPAPVRALALLLPLAAVLGGCPAVLDEPDAQFDALSAVVAEPLTARAPVVRVVAGRPDTLLAWDLFRTRRPVRFERHPDVAVAPLDGGRIVVTARAGFTGLATVPFSMGGAAYALAVESAQLPQVTFSFTPDLTPSDSLPRLPEVYVIGAFNDWSRTADRLEDTGDDGRLSRTLALAPGRYEYKLTVDGAEVLDPASADSVQNPFGAYNNVLVVPPVAPGALRLRLDGRSGAQAAFSVERTDADGRAVLTALDDADVVALFDNRPVPASAVQVSGAGLRVDLSAAPRGLAHLRLAVSQSGLVSNWTETPLYDGRPLGEAQARGDAPFVWQDAVIYQVVLDRFRNGDPANDAPVDTAGLDPRANYHGGDLAGLLEQIEAGYFTDLGVNALWISPVYDNPNRAYREYPAPNRLYTGYHGYWPVKPRAVDEHLGDVALLKRVVDAAHARGLKVLLDVVANHVHEDHPYFREHRDWFGTLDLPDGSQNLRRWDDYRLTTWFEPYLPSFDYDGAPEAVEQVTADVAWWLDATGADGIRHDAVKHIPNTFWRALTERLAEQVAPGRATPLYQIGETFGSYDLVDSYVRPGQLDAQFNFLLYDQTMAALARGSSLRALADEMDRSLRVFGPLHVMGSVLESHDKPRFLALVEDDLAGFADDKEPGWSDAPPRVDRTESYRRQALGLAFLLTTPGVPVIYYGGEIGMTGANDPDNRRPMQWDGLAPAQTALRAEVSRLAALRRDLPALRHGTFETLRADDEVWVYRRATPGTEVVVALNAGSADRPVSLPGDARGARDALDAAAPVGGRDGLSFTVPAGGYRVIAVRS
jgi:glycosidase